MNFEKLDGLTAEQETLGSMPEKFMEELLALVAGYFPEGYPRDHIAYLLVTGARVCLLMEGGKVDEPEFEKAVYMAMKSTGYAQEIPAGEVPS